MLQNEPTRRSREHVNGEDFSLALRTILSSRRHVSGHSVNAWATHAQVDARSLGRYLMRGRSNRFEYAWRLGAALGLPVSLMVAEAISLAYRTGPEGRPHVKGSDYLPRSPILHRVCILESGKATRALSQCLSIAVKNSGFSLARIAQKSGLSRPSLSRLGRLGRANHRLDYLFDLTLALSYPLDQLVREAEDVHLLPKPSTLEQ